MEAILRKSSYPCFQLVYAETFSLSEAQESVVTDTLPDVDAVVHASGCALIRSKDVSDGRIRLEAAVPARVSCLGEDGGLFSMDIGIPFYLNVQDERIPEDCGCVAELTLRQLDTRILNPRKLSVRAELTVTLRCYAPGAIETALAPADGAAHIHAVEQSAEERCALTVTEKTFVLTDEYALPEALPPVHELLAQNAEPVVQELRTVGTKLIASGVVKSELLYRDGEDSLHALSFQTSFSQIVESESETEGTQAELRVLLSGMYYEAIPGSDARELSMELHLVLQAVIFANREIARISDAYSNEFALEAARESREITRYVRDCVLRESGRAALETPEPVVSVLQCRVCPLEAVTEGAELRVRLRAVLCCQGERRPFTVERTVSQSFATETDASHTLFVCGVTVSEAQAQLAAGGAELRFTVEVRARLLERETLESIRAISYDEGAALDLDALPTLVMLRADSSTDLWTLAKENCSTVEAIRRANGLDEAGEDWEKLLLIPKAL